MHKLEFQGSNFFITFIFSLWIKNSTLQLKIMILPKKFYERDPAIVAKELIGKILVREYGGKVLKGMIVETEAYYGEEDPASRAADGKKKFNLLMWKDVGRTFIYMVHGNWLFNIIAHQKGKVGAVLIRAIEPLEGIEEMKKNRGIDDERRLTNGPGRLTKALRIDKTLNGKPLYRKGEIYLMNSKKSFEISSSRRIGVSRDLPINLRFFIQDNPFVSR